MARITQYRNFFTGGIFSFTYSPLGLDALDQFDQSPLLLFLGAENAFKTGHIVMGGLNLHWLTVSQRSKLIDIMIRQYKDESLKHANEWRQPLPISYLHIKLWAPELIVAYRRYIPSRVRSINQVSFDWNWDNVFKNIIGSDTERIIGVTPEYIQRVKRESEARKARAMKQRQTQVKKFKGKK